MPVQASRRLFTVDEFHQMADAGIFGDDDRVELLAGQIVEMTPADVLLAIEAAETSAATDRAEKVPLYGRAGIPEVWVVDLANRLIDVYRQPRPDGYRQHRHIGPGEALTSASLPALTLPVGDVLA